MRTFHAAVHRSSGRVVGERTVSLLDTSARVLDLTSDQLHEPWPIDFQTAFDRLERLPRMYIEMDGAWVWVGQASDGAAWQMDGLLNDSPRGLMTLEIKGRLPRAAWEDFRGQLVTSAETLVFQLMQEGVYLSEAEFARVFLGA